MLKKLSFLSAALLLATTVSACAPAATAGGNRDQNIITQEELQSIRASNLYEAVQRLRPRWLTLRSSQTFGQGAGMTQILVYQNQSRLGGPEVLRELGLDSAVWVEYMDRSRAMSTLPGASGQDVEGAIVIHTTPRP